ncbi:MAG: cytochrome c family protein [Gammaproteobacteria bacterium]|nr:cytochrome c family protein [Gammaproteobacteria bacterium]
MKKNKLSLIIFLIGSLLSCSSFAQKICIQQESSNDKDASPPLQQALGDDAFNKAMASKQYSYTGNAKCRLCHRDFFLGRKEDKHDHAYEHLVTAGAEYTENPRCLNCHTTGHGVKSGFQNMKRTPRLANVQCEGCHGPGSVHINREVAKMPAGGLVQIDKNSKEVAGGFLAGTDNPEILKKMCKSCHTQRWNGTTNNFDEEYNSYKSAKPSDNKTEAP